MEPYKAKKLPIEYSINKELINILTEAEETYGEYKGYLKNMSYDYSSFLECAFVSDLFYSFKIDGSKIEKEYMFHTPYMIKNNDYIEFNNMKKALLIGVNDFVNNTVSVDTFSKINKTLFMNCKKNNLTKGSGKLRKAQNYILKPGIAGSSVSFVPPVYTELSPLMNNLIDYIKLDGEQSVISSIITHYQFEKLHPYVSGNGKIGRLIMPIQISAKKKEPPILFISETLDKFKNTYFTLMSGEIEEDIDKYIKFMLQTIIEQCNTNIKKIKKLNKIYKNDFEEFKETIGGTTINKVYPYILKKIVFTTNDVVTDCKLHINSVNKVLNKMVEYGYLIKEKKKGSNRVTFCYKSFYDVFMS